MTKKKKSAVKPEIKETAPSLKDQIKAMEEKKRAKAAPKEKAPRKVSFDSWYHLRKVKIPVHHLKEIIWSYFKSRGLTTQETIEKYDNELKRYGISI